MAHVFFPCVLLPEKKDVLGQAVDRSVSPFNQANLQTKRRKRREACREEGDRAPNKQNTSPGVGGFYHKERVAWTIVNKANLAAAGSA